MEIAAAVGKLISDDPFDTHKIPPGFFTKGDKICVVVRNIDPRGILSHIPKTLFVLQLIPLVGIVAGAITFRAAYRNERLIKETTGLPGLDNDSLLTIRSTQVWAILSMLGLALPVFVLTLALALVAATIAFLIIAPTLLVRTFTLGTNNP
ncbi:hypothetical protein [Chlamydiifrater phoenicopteri]|uniref:hypothetical protein n=1 Tax=Chlamydiifrater phoenicopteri TaxID=2681469 RepID=UPI001BCF931F|nr:hypothetical protein [Chlamydiifrater phoenicopteri]